MSIVKKHWGKLDDQMVSALLCAAEEMLSCQNEISKKDFMDFLFKVSTHLYGSQVKLAEVLDIDPPRVSRWLKMADVVFVQDDDIVSPGQRNKRRYISIIRNDLRNSEFSTSVSLAIPQMRTSSVKEIHFSFNQ